MIKHLLFTVGLLVTVGVISSNGQCTPDASHTSTGFAPSSIANGSVGAAYNQVVQVRVPPDASEWGLPVATVDWFIIDTIENLPTGLTWTCSEDSCKFPGNSNGCMDITGTPVAADDGKEFKLYIKYRAVGVAFGQPVDLPITDSSYTMCIGTCPTGIVDGLDPNSFGLLQNVPNPFTTNTIIEFNSPVAKDVDFTVVNLLGQQVHAETISAAPGVNRIDYKAGNGTGVFLYNISDGKVSLTKRMVVSGN